MKKTLLSVGLVLLNGTIGLIVLFFYSIGYNGLFTEPRFSEALFGFVLMVLFLIILGVQFYFLFFRKKDTKTKRSYVITASVIILLFCFFNYFTLFSTYENDEYAYKDPVFKRFYQEYTSDSLIFNRKESDYQTRKNSSYYFYFDRKENQELSMRDINHMAKQIPKNLEQDTYLVIVENETDFYFPLSKEREVVNCFVHDFEYSTKDTLCLDVSGYVNTDPNIARIYNNVEYYNATKNTTYRFLINESNESVQSPEISKETLYNLNDEKLVIESKTSPIYFEKTTGKITEEDMENMLHIIGETQSNFAQQVYVSYLTETETGEEIIFSTYYGSGSDDVSIAITYLQCDVSFCENIASYRPNNSNAKYIYN